MIRCRLEVLGLGDLLNHVDLGAEPAPEARNASRSFVSTLEYHTRELADYCGCVCQRRNSHLQCFASDLLNHLDLGAEPAPGVRGSSEHSACHRRCFAQTLVGISLQGRSTEGGTPPENQTPEDPSGEIRRVGRRKTKKYDTATYSICYYITVYHILDSSIVRCWI